LEPRLESGQKQGGVYVHNFIRWLGTSHEVLFILKKNLLQYFLRQKAKTANARMNKTSREFKSGHVDETLTLSPPF
jgi:hypothetical protein